MRLIALDMGSSSTKCAVLNETGVLSQHMLPTPPNAAHLPLRYEVDAEAYFQQVETMLNAAGDADGILISTQMHGCVLTDAGFHPLTGYISWQDQTSLLHLDGLRETLGSDACAPSGVPVKGNLALCSLIARKREDASFPLKALFCTLGGYIIGRLCGEHVCHMTNAAPTGLADIRNGTWNASLIERVGLNGLRFPRIESGLAPVGTWHGIPVYPDLGDQQVCVLGASLPHSTGLHISLGTAGLAGTVINEWGNGAYENRPWLIPVTYLRTVSGLPGGRQLLILNRFLKNTASLFNANPPSEDAVFSWMNSLACTHDTPPDDLWQILRGGPEVFTSAVYHHVALAYCSAAEQMDIHPAHIAFSGGLAEKNPALRSVIAAGFPLCQEAPVFNVMAGMHRLAAYTITHRMEGIAYGTQG